LSLRLDDFDFALPPELIAQAPLLDRAGARMLVVHRQSGQLEDRLFRDLPGYLQPGDCLVLNDSRVIPARLYGNRPGRTGRVEVLLVRPRNDNPLQWTALVRPGRKLPVGERIEFGEGLAAQIVGRSEQGERLLKFEAKDFWERLEALGHIPLPPYIHRDDSSADRERYQTVYARDKGSVAAPTAGLHFTHEVMEACRQAGAETAYVTLHVGLGTFQPIEADHLSQVKLHAERFEIPAPAAEALGRANRVIPVGTTALRSIESWAAGRHGETDLFISPGYGFQVAQGLLTNFHLPRSSLFVLVSALGGVELMRAAYRHAVEQRYRFYSYGDCMLIL
jgi:S-adenosylmethionine:tRNA ribosyltransferase-isomerase